MAEIILVFSSTLLKQQVSLAFPGNYKSSEAACNALLTRSQKVLLQLTTKAMK